MSPLILAVKLGRRDIVDMLLNPLKDDPNRLKQYLQICFTGAGHFSSCGEGACDCSADEGSGTALGFAASNDNLEMVTFLVGLGASDNLPITEDGGTAGRPALVRAAASGNIEIAQFLLDRGASIESACYRDTQNNTGLTVGIAAGSIVSLVAIVVAVVFLRKRPSNLKPLGGAAVPKTGARGRNSLRNKREPSQRSNTRPSSSVRRGRASSAGSSASARRAAAKGKKPSPTSKRESARGKGRRSSISSSTPSAARTSTKSKRRSNSMHVSNPAFALETARALPPIPRKINVGGDDDDAYDHDGDQQRELDGPNDAYGTVKAFALGGAVRAVAHVKEDISGTPLYQNTADAKESPQLDADLY